MITAVVSFMRAWIARFVGVQGVDRAMALAAQAFSALIPLLIVYTAVVSSDEGSSFADSLIDRFDLDGDTAAAVREAFSSSAAVEDSVSMLGILLLLISALSFTRGMQRLYETSYGLPTLGMRNTKWGLAWLAMVVLYYSVRPPITTLVEGPFYKATVSLVLAAAAWTVTPYLLLGKRLRFRPLLPGALLSSIGMTALGASSVIWFPPTLESTADQFGVMGVAFALLSWLVAAGFVIVIAATGGAVTTDAVRRRWKR